MGRPGRRWSVLAALGAVLASVLWLRGREPSREASARGDTEARVADESATARAAPAAREPDAPAPDAARLTREGIIELRVSGLGVAQAGARVRLFRRGERDPNTGELLWGAAGAGATGADGMARLPAVPGHYLALVELAGYAAGRLEIRRPGGEKVTRAQLALEKGVVLSGQTVLRKTHEPVPLAHLICVQRATSTAPLSELPPEAGVVASSDARGQFVIAGLAPGTWRIEASAEGFGRAAPRELVLPRTAPLTLELVSPAYLEGHVFAADGSPARGAELVARASGPGALAPGRSGPTTGDGERATSTSGGAFSLEVAPGNWQLSAWLGGDAASLPHALAITAGETRGGLELRLAPGAIIAGAVLHKGDLAPLAGARVAVSPHGDNGDSGRALAGADGAFAVPALAPGSYDVVVSLEGFRSEELRGVTLASGQRFEKRFELAGSGVVLGSIRDAKGRPIEGAIVSGKSGERGDAAEAKSGGDGSYRLNGVSAGSARLTASRPGAALGATSHVEVREGETAHLDFTLADTGRVQGRVTRANGPLPEQLQVFASADRARRAEGQAFCAVSGDGSYQLELPAGAYRLEARGGDVASAAVLVAIESGETLSRDLQLPDASEVGLTVQVLEPGGAPSPFATLAITATNSGRGSFFFQPGQCDSDGRFALARARADLPDSIDIRASNGARQGKITVGAGLTDATVQLQAAASLHGRLVADAPVNSFALTVAAGQISFGVDEPRQFVGAQFDLPDLEAGSYRLRALTDDGRSGEATATLAAGETGEVELALQPNTSVSGRCVDASGAPLAGAYVRLDGNPSGSSSNESGLFRFDGIVPGSHQLVAAEFSQSLAATLPFALAQGQQLDLGDVILKAPKTGAGMIGISLRGDASGVYVNSVTPNGPADQAGLLTGDQIVAVDGSPIAGITDAIQRIRGAAGTPVTLTILRNGRAFSVQLLRASD